MTIEVVAFIIGGILVATAIVGGGFEVKEIKMPRVGAGVRIVSLVVGSGFLLLAMGIWGMNNPALVAETPPVSSYLPADTAASAPVEQPARQVVQEAQPAAAQAEPEWGQPVEVAAFTGFSGQTNLVWTTGGVVHSGAVNFAGASGYLRVTYLDPSDQTNHVVDQDLTLRESKGGFWYMGSNPRDAYTQQALDESLYSRDRFRVVPDGSGGWTIDQVCALGSCFPVSVQ
jgi:hypothetical protein